MQTLTIRDETTSNLGKTDFVITINLTSRRLTARELIRERVKQEVEDFNNKQPELFNGWSNPPTLRGRSTDLSSKLNEPSIGRSNLKRQSKAFSVMRLFFWWMICKSRTWTR